MGSVVADIETREGGYEGVREFILSGDADGVVVQGRDVGVNSQDGVGPW